MKHLNEEELFSLQMNENISDEAKAHFDTCLFCQTELKHETEFDSVLSNSMQLKSDKDFDIRQEVFNQLNIDFKVEDNKDYFSIVTLSLFTLIASLLLYIYPLQIDFTSLYSWIPSENLNVYYSKYKMLFIGSMSFLMLYFLDRMKVSIKHSHKQN